VRDYQIADQNYRVYLQGVQEARVFEDLNKAKVTSIAVFDAPYAPPRPIKPGLMVLLLGTFGGVVLGLILAFVTEALDETRAGYLARQLVQTDAVIIDELGYLPFPASGGALLFHLISQLYEKTSLIFTTNLSFAE
jgi:hypothetical protein